MTGKEVKLFLTAFRDVWRGPLGYICSDCLNYRGSCGAMRYRKAGWNLQVFFRQASHRRAAVSRGEYIRHCLVKSALRSGFHTSLPVWGWFCFWFLRWHETGLRLSNSKMIIKVSHFNFNFLSVQGSESKTLNTWMSFPMYRTSFSCKNVYKHASVNLHRQMRYQDVMLIYSSNCCWISILAV